jgi:hypothetical protein
VSNILLTIYLIIKISYPSSDIKSIQQYNQIVENAFQSYCFLDIEYDLTTVDSLADIVIYPEFDLSFQKNLIGYTNGTIGQNPKFYGQCTILLSKELPLIHKCTILRHELYHSFVGAYHNLYDVKSLMYPLYDGTNDEFSRYDSLYIRSNFLIDYTRLNAD